MPSDSPLIGIDLGTTNSLVGVVDSGFPILLADEQGDRLLPSAVLYREDGTIQVGREALRSRALAPERTITSIKRFLGRRFSQIQPEEHAGLSYQLVDDGSDRPVVLLPCGRKVSPEEVSAEILGNLKAVAEAALETDLARAVVTVPAYFSNSQREATKKAAEMAGLTVERIINEPTAAALSYGLDKLEENRSVAVYDLGGGTFDLSILQMREGLFEVISTAGDTQLGGDDFDQAILEELRCVLSLGSLSPEEQATLLAAAREAKESLSSETVHTVRLPFFRDGESFEHTLDRERCEELLAPVLERTRTICKHAFGEAARKGVETVDHLILVGGSTRLPLVAEKLRAWFDMEPDRTQHPDESVALGAAIQAGILDGQVRSIVLVDVTPLSLGIETFGGLMNVIIPRNSTIPAKAGELFTNAIANQESMAIRVLQGEREMARDNWLLGEVEVPFTPGAKGSARVGVQFSIDADGILEVLARDTATGEDHVLEIRDAAVDVDDKAVEKMVSESIDYAFDDMNERVWTEAKLKSEELLPAVEVALEQVGGQLDPEEKEQIQQAMDAVRGLLDLPNRDAAALKQANANLDESTQHLAALLVEAAFSFPEE